MQDWIDDFLHYLRATKGASERTVSTYEDSLIKATEYFVAQAGRVPTWTELVLDDFRAWEAEQMGRGYSPAYVKKNMAALRSFYRYLLREGRVQVDPVRLVKNPKLQKRLPTFIRENEMDRLFEYYDFGEGYEGSRNHMILLLLYHTGIRASELLGLNAGDVDLDNFSLRVTGKGNKQRIIPFGEELHSALILYIEECRKYLANEENGVSSFSQSTPLFLNSQKRRLAYNPLRVIVNEALSAVTTQKKRSPHVLRHSFATAMLAHGAQLEAIQQLLGHESVATTAIYTHTTLAELKEQYSQAHPRNTEK